MTRDELLRQVDAGWNEFRQALDAVPEDGFRKPLAAGWTVPELLAHVAFWEETVAPFVAGMLRAQGWPEQGAWHGGDPFDDSAGWPHFDVHNAREAAWARRVTLDEVWARLERAHTAMRSCVESFTDTEAADERFAQHVAAETYDHYREHVAELRAAFGVGPQAGPGPVSARP